MVFKRCILDARWTITPYKGVAFSNRWYEFDYEHRDGSLIRKDKWVPTPEQKKAYKI